MCFFITEMCRCQLVVLVIRKLEGTQAIEIECLDQISTSLISLLIGYEVPVH